MSVEIGNVTDFFAEQSLPYQTKARDVDIKSVG